MISAWEVMLLLFYSRKGCYIRFAVTAESGEQAELFNQLSGAVHGCRRPDRVRREGRSSHEEPGSTRLKNFCGVFPCERAKIPRVRKFVVRIKILVATTSRNWQAGVLLVSTKRNEAGCSAEPSGAPGLRQRKIHTFIEERHSDLLRRRNGSP